MNSIEILHSHSYDKESACQKAEHMLEDLASDYGLEIQSQGDGCINFKGSGISGTVVIEHNEIHFNATLSFLMVAMKPIISNAIEVKLKENFD